jgi:hypothetical protein
MGLLYRPVRRADNLTTFMCRLSWNLGASTYWNPQGLSRPVRGLIYRPVRRADNLTTFMCRLSRNVGASASWNPQGLSRTVMGLLYLKVYASVEFICIYSNALCADNLCWTINVNSSDINSFTFGCYFHETQSIFVPNCLQVGRKMRRPAQNVLPP